MTTYLSGLQPSGRQHIGNYFGAIRQHIELSRTDGEHFFFIADYHALTTSRDAEQLREQVREMLVTYLALGLDPDHVTLFRQSDVPEVTELAWLLATVTGMGLLERAHSYKDKLAHGIKPNVGLFTYPVLMAADILAYDSTHVPVGKDQVQHVEMAQDMCGYFNGAYGGAGGGGDLLVRPEALIPDNELMAKVPGLDGEKMSKSYGNELWIFESGKKLRKACGRIVTDSRPPEDPKDPSEILPLKLLALFVDADELESWHERVRGGGPDAPGYGQMKVRLAEAMDETFAPARARREELLADPGELDRILARGVAPARERARATVDRCYRACGIR